LDVHRIRALFPQLKTEVRGQPFIYFDNAATTLKPTPVITTMTKYYQHEVANIHRGAHFFGNQGTERYEKVRDQVARFLNASTSDEIVFTKGTTEGLNMIAQSYAREQLQPGDEILLTEVEHHSNIVPWQIVAQQRDLKIRVLPILDSCQWDMARLNEFLTERTKLVSISHISNVTGLIHPIEQVIARARAVGAVTVIDAAQAIFDLPIDVQKLDCDFLVFSGHKILGPFGVGVVFARKKILEAMVPYQSGGSMISKVSFAKTSFLPPPQKFEAGTPNVVGVIGLGAAVEYVDFLGRSAIHEHKQQLRQQLEQALADIPHLRVFGQGPHKTSVCSFEIAGVHPSDIGQILDEQGIAVRTGHLCAQPLADRLGVAGFVRASLSIYNTADEIQQFAHSLKKAQELFN
jgi:cysteine desulfurase/selenocysteine lyase